MDKKKDTTSSDAVSETGVRLKRELGLFSAVSMIVGVMIGSGIFVSPTSALRYSGSVGLCTIIWVLCGGISLLGALAFAELGTVVPRSGAEYAYFQEAFARLHPYWGPMPSFICSWVYIMILKPAEIAVLLLTFSEYTIQPFEGLFDYDYIEYHKNTLKKLVAILTLGLMTYINLSSVKLYVKLQNIFAFCKVLACLVVIVGGAYALGIGYTENLAKGFEGTQWRAGNLALAFYSGLWAYDGWTAVTTVTEEIQNPSKNIPRSVLIAVPLITGLYVFMNVAYMAVLSYPEMIATTAIAVDFGHKALGPFKLLIPIGVAIATFGCAMSIQFGVTRLCYVAGQNGHTIEAFSFVHIRKFTPAPAVAFQGIIAFLFILAGNIEALIEFASFLIWIFYGGAMIALLVMRRTHAKLHRPYKVPLIIPWFILAVSVFLSVVPIISDPSIKYLFALGFILFGVMVYTYFIYKKKRPKLMDKITYATQVFFEVVPPLAYSD